MFKLNSEMIHAFLKFKVEMNLYATNTIRKTTTNFLTFCLPFSGYINFRVCYGFYLILFLVILNQTSNYCFISFINESKFEILLSKQKPINNADNVIYFIPDRYNSARFLQGCVRP